MTALDHHYFGWLTGTHGEMYQLDDAKVGMNPTTWDARDKSTKPANLTYPTNLVFKENPGGEYRKSYHGYPHGYATLLHSPEVRAAHTTDKLTTTDSKRTYRPYV